MVTINHEPLPRSSTHRYALVLMSWLTWQRTLATPCCYSKNNFLFVQPGHAPDSPATALLCKHQGFYLWNWLIITLTGRWCVCTGTPEWLQRSDYSVQYHLKMWPLFQLLVHSHIPLPTPAYLDHWNCLWIREWAEWHGYKYKRCYRWYRRKQVTNNYTFN